MAMLTAEDIEASFVIRFGFFYMIVILFVIIIYFGNILMLSLQPTAINSVSPKITALRVLFVLSLSDLIGTGIFFFL